MMAHQGSEIEPAENNTARSAAESIGEDQLGSMTKGEEGRTSPPKNHGEAGPDNTDAQLQNDPVAYCLPRFERELKKYESHFQPQPLSCSIFRIPSALREINLKAHQPELVSIGPYHRKEESLGEFQMHKWFFLKSFLRRTGENVESLIRLAGDKEISAWRCCYSERVDMLKGDFVEMMLLDGCFVVELLLHISTKDHATDEDNPVLTRPQIIPILIGDLLKLENQVPYSLLELLFNFSSSTRIKAKTRYLCMLALRVFNLVYPRPNPNEYTDLQYRRYDEIKNREYRHLLDLFKFTLFPTMPADFDCEQEYQQSDQSTPLVTQRRPSGIKINCDKRKSILDMGFRKQVPETIPLQDCKQKYRPSEQSIPCVTQLRPSGIKFKAKKTESFLDISFQKRVLDRVLNMPPIFLDDFIVTVLINCTAFEQCQENSSKHITSYVSFMHCLINESKDVWLLCSDGIISTSYNDHFVADLFNNLGKNILYNYRDCYLSKLFEELESYYSSSWASMIRTYFSSPWSVISVFSAFLIIALTITQTVYAILGALGQHSH